MADLKISELPAATAPTGVELIEIVQGGVNKQTTTQDIADLASGGVSSVFTRNGAVVSANGDYTATQITNTPAGTIAATTVQAAIDELDSEKQSAAQVQAIADAKVADAINNGTTTIAPSQNAVFDALALKQDLVNTAVAITDAASMDLTAIKHTLTTSSATRTFTISYTGDDITLEVTLNTTGSTFTFPAASLCVSEGIPSGDNTCLLAGASGDIYVFAIKKIGTNYRVVSKNFGQ